MWPWYDLWINSLYLINRLWDMLL